MGNGGQRWALRCERCELCCTWSLSISVASSNVSSALRDVSSAALPRIRSRHAANKTHRDVTQWHPVTSLST